MSLATINKVGLYAMVTLTGMVVAALAAYYILVEFIYPLKNSDVVPEQSHQTDIQIKGDARIN